MTDLYDTDDAYRRMTEIERRIDELAEGQSRSMNDLFAIVNLANARARVLEQRVQWLEVALRGLMSASAPYRVEGGIYDARSTWEGSSNTSGAIAPGNAGSPEDCAS